jgi:integrase
MSLRLYQRTGSRVWYVRGTVRGRAVYESSGTTNQGLAEAFRAKRETELFERAIFGARATVSFRRAALDYLDFTPRSRATDRYVLRLIEHFGDVLVARIDQNAADGAVAAIVGAGRAPATKIRAVYTPLTAILTFGHARQWCDRPHFAKPTPPDGKTRWLTPAEALGLLTGAAPHLRPLLHFILCTGARLGEALDIDWADIDIVATKAIFRGTKARSGHRRDRVAALPAAAVMTLANLPGRDGRVFRTDNGQPYADRQRLEGGQISTAFATACRRAGLYNVTPHDLRHTWATWFYALSKDLLLLKDEGAWRTLRMVERYAHLMPAALAPAIADVWGPSHPRIGALLQNGAVDRAGPGQNAGSAANSA